MVNSEKAISMLKVNPEYMSKIMEATNNCPYFRLQNMRLLNFDAGISKLEIDIDPGKHYQPFGITHGGVVCSIIDAAAFWAVYGQAPENVGMTSVDLKLNYLAPASGTKLVAQGKMVKLGRTLGYGQAEVLDENGKILAAGASTLMVIPELPFIYAGQLPPKFL